MILGMYDEMYTTGRMAGLNAERDSPFAGESTTEG